MAEKFDGTGLEEQFDKLDEVDGIEKMVAGCCLAVTIQELRKQGYEITLSAKIAEPDGPQGKEV